VEERTVAAGHRKLPRLLVETALAASMAEARRLIEQGGVSVDGERITRVDHEVDLSGNRAALLQVGKRRFLRVRET
jgi:tyrosyl-tRNA synthetase